jgi:hypothetical protein
MRHSGPTLPGADRPASPSRASLLSRVTTGRRARGAAATFALAAGAFTVPQTAVAQSIIGQCVIPASNRSYVVRSDFYFISQQSPALNAATMVDPSGQTFLFIQSGNPALRYFVTWQGNVIEMNTAGQWGEIGSCQIQIPPPSPPPPIPIFRQGQISFDDGSGSLGSPRATGAPPGGWQVPREMVESTLRTEGEAHLPTAIPTESEAQQCWVNASNGANREAFLDCLAPKAMGSKELAAYRCMRGSRDRNAMGFCLVKNNMGQAEQRAMSDVEKCYGQHGNNWMAYSGCLAPAALQMGGADPKVMQAVRCLQTSSPGGQFNGWAMAGCYLGPQVMAGLNLNAEALMALECAQASGGNPTTFAGCTGGRLMAAELDKCFQNGVGGSNGCFGPNNFFTEQFNNIGQAVAANFGPGHVMTRGPGQNHELVKFADNVGREASQAGQNVAREVRKVVPRIKIRW